MTRTKSSDRLKNDSRTGHVIWAVDPTEKGPLGNQARVKHLVERAYVTLDTHLPLAIEPVYVLRLNTAIAADVGNAWRTDLVNAAENALGEYVKRTASPVLTAPRVLVSPSSSIRLAAEALIRHAEISGAELIISQTHGRSGIERIFLGSFAETLAVRSKTPVLLVNPKTKYLKRIDHILFPTDFTNDSVKEFRSVLGLASRFEARITLFHARTKNQDPRLEETFRKRALQWSRVANNRGITVDIVLHAESRDAANDILNIANSSEASLIAMPIGNVTRKVIRNALCPVWILRPNDTSDRLAGETAARLRSASSSSSESFQHR